MFGTCACVFYVNTDCVCVQERLLRTGEFCLKGMTALSGEDHAKGKHELSTIESLLGIYIFILS